MTLQKQYELLSPVGSFESLSAAIQAGANGVYLGVDQLNMRAHSSINFTVDQLPKIVDIAKAKNVSVYLTLNTVVYDHELEQVYHIVDAAVKYGIDAIIASDMAVIKYAESCNMLVHASTQLNISNIEAVKFFSRYCNVMVLARELSLDQIESICRKIEMENIHTPTGKRVRIEVFVHGALCMAISGKCYLSLHEYNHAANRGSCFQTCRRAYDVIDKETGRMLTIDNQYIMSPKDLCTLGFVDKIVHAGVEVFKIEGRARGPEYVHRVTGAYRRAIDAVLEDKFNNQLAESLIESVSDVFNRGFWDGYYMGKKLGEWSNRYGSHAKFKKEYVAKATNYFSKLKVAEFKLESGEVKIGDKVLIIGPTTGVIELIINEMHNNTGPVGQVNKGELFSIPVDKQIRRNDKLYLFVPNDSKK